MKHAPGAPSVALGSKNAGDVCATDCVNAADRLNTNGWGIGEGLVFHKSGEQCNATKCLAGEGGCASCGLVGRAVSGMGRRQRLSSDWLYVLRATSTCKWVEKEAFRGLAVGRE